MSLMRSRRFFGTAVMIVLILVVVAFAVRGEEELEIIAGPYLHYPTETTMRVGWETSVPASAEVGFGPGANRLTWVAGEEGQNFHTVILEGLEPGGYYFYQVRSKTAAGDQVESAIYTFQTAVSPEAPFSFVVLSDTVNPVNVARLAERWGQRPQFT